MTLRASLVIGADAEGAKAGIKATTAEVDKLGKEVDQASTEADKLKKKIGGVPTAVPGLRTTEKAAKSVGEANRVAAGSVANLTAQFNDIGVMMAAGQSPLQLAIQQGTQISQVIGPMGAAGAVKSLGTAFLGMISPVSLVTLGVIAGGAALGQWAMEALSAGEETETFADNLAKMEENTGAAETALSSLKDLTAEYDRLVRARAITQDQTSSAVILSLAREANAQRALAEIETIRSGRAIATLKAQVETARAELEAIQQDKIEAARDALGVNVTNTTERDGGQFVRGPQERAALELVLERTAARQQELRAIMAVTDEESAQAEELRLQEAQLTLQQQALASIERQMNAITEAGRSGTAAIMEGATASERSAEAWVQQKLAAIEAGAEAQEQLAELQAQADLQALIARYGEDSLEVKTAIVQAER
ncbi:MAG: phage tail length tape measure family protein, partial [Jannaschia sp.]